MEIDVFIPFNEYKYLFLLNYKSDKYSLLITLRACIVVFIICQNVNKWL